MNSTKQYASFIVRIWPELNFNTLHGELVHIQSGEAKVFENLEALVETISQIYLLSPKELLMSHKVLQINFKFNVTATEFEQTFAPFADAFAAIPGLRWKVWILNAANSEAGGIYLFEDGNSLETFLESELADGVVKHPMLSDFAIKSFDVMAAQSMITRGLV